MQRYPPKYAPHETFMSNVVKTSGCRPLFQRRRMPWWLRAMISALLFLVLVITFFGAMFIIAEAIVQ